MLQAVIQILVNDTLVASSIGNDGATSKVKVYPVLADEKTDFPFVVCKITGNAPDQCKDAPSRLDTVSFDVDIYSKDYPKLDRIANNIRFCLDGVKSVSSGIDIDCWFVTERDGFDPGQNYVRSMSFNAYVRRDVGQIA